MKLLLSILLKLHAHFCGNNERFRYKKTNPFLWIISVLIYRVSEFMASKLLDFWKPKYVKNLDPNSDFIICLTTYTKRIDTVWKTIHSLFNQDVMPAKVILYLSLEEFNGNNASLPLKLQNLIAHGLDVVYVEDNLKSHKKYYYALSQMGKIYNCITADDDVYYRPNMTKRLLELHKENPFCVCANNVSKITKQKGEICNYLEWEGGDIRDKTTSLLLVAIGFGGVLYPKGIFQKNNIIFDIEKIKRLSLNADDLWLKANEIIDGVKVATGSYYSAPLSIVNKAGKTSSLCIDNSYGNGNDVQWSNIDRELNINRILKEYMG